MSARPSRRGDGPPLTVVYLLDSLLGCDSRTRRARSLIVTASTCAALLTLTIITAFAIAFGIMGAACGGLLTTLIVRFAGRSIRRRRRKGSSF